MAAVFLGSRLVIEQENQAFSRFQFSKPEYFAEDSKCSLLGHAADNDCNVSEAELE